VSSRPSGELRLNERWYANREDPKVGDIIDIAFKSKSAHAYQCENHLIDDRFHWNLLGRIKWGHLDQLIDNSGNSIWINNFSTRYGTNEQIPASLVGQLSGTLKLIRVLDFRVIIAHEWPDYGNKRKTRGGFTYGGAYYRLSISDPVLESQYAQHADGEYHIGEAVLCISVSELYKEHAYKVIASVILKGVTC